MSAHEIWSAVLGTGIGVAIIVIVGLTIGALTGRGRRP